MEICSEKKSLRRKQFLGVSFLKDHEENDLLKEELDGLHV